MGRREGKGKEIKKCEGRQRKQQMALQIQLLFTTHNTLPSFLSFLSLTYITYIACFSFLLISFFIFQTVGVCDALLDNFFLMNNQLSSAKQGDYTSNQGIAKSEKILNSVSNFHMKTQQVDKNEQDRKSPENNRTDLRETWRKPRMPYNKLPDAFQIKPKKKKTNREVLDNIDRIVKFNEYKEIQKYLEPISLEKKQDQRPKDFTENGNPLATYQKYLKIKSKFSEQIQEKDLSTNKYKAFSTKQPASLIKITDCITLDVIKRGHNTGTIKKMLHVPTLRLVCVREEPLNSKEARHTIKEWLLFWQTKLNYQENKRFVNVLGTVYNLPQGAVSIITDYYKFGTLLDLLDAVITLPESVIREIFVQVFESLGYFYEISDSHFGGFSPSQILITDEGKIKLGLGIYYHLSLNSNSIYNIKINTRPNIFQFNATQKHFMKASIEKQNVELEKSMDIFKLGLMMLECAIGGFQKFEHSSILHQSIKTIFSQEGQLSIQKENVCCLIHSEAYLLQAYAYGQQDQRSRRDRLEIGKVLLYFKYIKDRFSLPFINFLCQCLKLNHNKRATFRELISHSFLRNDTSKDTKTVMISLSDLLLINNDWNQEFLESTQQQRVDKFIGHVLHVLNGCRREVVVDLVMNHKESILNLAKNIDLNYVNLGEKLYSAMMEMAKLEKRDFTSSI